MKYLITFIIVAGIGVFLLNYFQSVGQPEKKPMKQMKEVFVDPTDYKKLAEKNKERIQEYNKKLKEKETINPIIKEDTEALIKKIITYDDKKIEVNKKNNNQNNQLPVEDFIVLKKTFLGKKHNILQIKYKISKKYTNKDLKILVKGSTFQKIFSIYPLDTENEDILGEVPSQNIISITLIKQNQLKQSENNNSLNKLKNNSIEDIAEKSFDNSTNTEYNIPTTENSSLNLDPTLKTILKEIGN